MARFPSRTALAAGTLIALSACVAVATEETVIISKSRLVELERKEAELERIQAELRAAKTENLAVPQPAGLASALIPHVSPAMDSLPPLKAEELVDARDVFNHFRADPAVAERRYGKQVLTVRGTVMGFEKPAFARPYHILLRTTDRIGCVVCKFDPPEKFNAVFTVRNGTELVGESGARARVSIAKVGDEVTLRGKCKGAGRDGNVLLTGCEWP